MHAINPALYMSSLDQTLASRLAYVELLPTEPSSHPTGYSAWALKSVSLPQCVLSQEHTDKGHGTKGSSRGWERKVGRDDSHSVQWGLVPRKFLAIQQNPSPSSHILLSLHPALVSPVPPSLTISEAACQHQMSCWNLPSKSQSLPLVLRVSRLGPPPFLDSAPALPWYSHLQSLWFPTSPPLASAHCPLCSVEYSPRCHLPGFFRPTQLLFLLLWA